MTFDELAPDLQTGDLFLFHGTEWTSRLIQEVTHSFFSHVAMIVRTEGTTGPDGLNFWQSWEPAGGVIFSSARDFFMSYEATPGQPIYVRQLTAPRTPAMQQTLQQQITELKGRPFPSIVDFVLHWIEGEKGINSGQSNFFCSQLAAATYQALGWLPTLPVPNSYSPESFSDKNPALPLQGSASLGAQMVVTVS